ncbi:M24 family metallopeptidase, partial [candidate division WOR-3 bacterium]|nr:M24 family metallopeptidase [candidate division WOR-3 bacterium]
MALYIKSEREIEGMRAAGRVAAALLKDLAAEVRPGRSLKELEEFCVGRIRQAGAEPTFLGYRGFPAGACISVN